MPAHELVPGDVLLLQPGDQVCADIRVFEVNGLQVEEAMLTGESVPAGKHEAPVEADAVLGDRRSMAFGGTLVVAGTAKGVVTATGAGTQLGRISQLLSETAELETPLTRRLGRLARAITGPRGRRHGACRRQLRIDQRRGGRRPRRLRQPAEVARLHPADEPRAGGVPPELARAESQTVAVTTIILFQCAYLLNCRSLTQSAHRIGWFSNRYVYFGIAATLVLQLCFVYAPPLNALFHTHPLDAMDWIAPTLVALAGLPVVALEKRFWRRRAKSGHDGATAMAGH